jgi:hypothetical protein
MPAASYQEDPRVYNVLKDFCDVPSLSYESSERLLVARHDELKRAFLVATVYYVYLFKEKGMKLYTRWPARHLSVTSDGENVFFSIASNAEDVAKEYRKYQRSGGGSNNNKKRKHSDSDEDDEEDPLDSNDDSFVTCRIQCESVNVARSVDKAIRSVIFEAKRLEVKHRREEEGIRKAVAKVVAPDDTDAEDNDSLMDEDLFDDDEDLNDEAEGDDEQHLYEQAVAAQQPANSKKMLRAAPGRYLAVSSLVDGEFADYTALKNAYLRNEDASLLDDLAAFIAENEQQVDAVCRTHYPVFLRAVRGCQQISTSDADLVREELAAASQVVLQRVNSIRESGVAYLGAKSTLDEVFRAKTCVEHLLAVSEIIEYTEKEVSKGRLVGAATSVRRLAGLTPSVTSMSLGDYLVSGVIPRIEASITTAAVQRLNEWLMHLREHAPQLGRSGLQSSSGVRIGEFVGFAVVTEEGQWSIRRRFVRGQVSFAPPPLPATAAAAGTAAAGSGVSVPAAASSETQAAGSMKGDDTTTATTSSSPLEVVAHGSAIQNIFRMLRKEDLFQQLYVSGRQRQIASDLGNPSSFSSQNAAAGDDAEAALEQLRRYGYAALGTIITEDTVMHTTTPPIVAASEIILLWQMICEQLVVHANRVESALLAAMVTQQQDLFSKKLSALFEFVVKFAKAARRVIHGVALDPLGLNRLMEGISSRLHTSWLQECCEACTVAVVTDPIDPVPINNLAEFEANVTRFHFHRHRPNDTNALPINTTYRSGTILLPFTICVPAVGARVLSFLAKLFESAKEGNEVNNLDTMVLEYLAVVLRTVHGVLQSRLVALPSQQSLMQSALFYANGVAMHWILSTIEIYFASQWQGAYCTLATQQCGVPSLLASSGKLYRDLLPVALDKINENVLAEVREMLQPLRQFDVWRRRLIAAGKLDPSMSSQSSFARTPRSDGKSLTPSTTPRNSSAAAGKGGELSVDPFTALRDFADNRLAKLRSILPLEVVRNVTSFAALQVGLLLPDLLQSGLNVYHDGFEVNLYLAALEEMQSTVQDFKLSWLTQLDRIAPWTKAHDLPLDLDSVCQMLAQMIHAREAELAVERAKQVQLLASMEAAGMKVVSGVADLGKATGKGLMMMGRVVKNNVLDARSVVVGATYTPNNASNEPPTPAAPSNASATPNPKK